MLYGLRGTACSWYAGNSGGPSMCWTLYHVVRRDPKLCAIMVLVAPCLVAICMDWDETSPVKPKTHKSCGTIMYLTGFTDNTMCPMGVATKIPQGVGRLMCHDGFKDGRR